MWRRCANCWGSNMGARYPIPAGECQAEIEVEKSRFIASLAPAFTVEEAKQFVKQVKTQFADATHNVPAYVVGYGSSTIAHCHDDGEPSGTAGRPVLAVLQGSGLGDVVVVVTRYFGGTKLGTGGLVRAYGDAVRAVLAIAPLAEKVPTHTMMLALPYSHLERVRLLVQEAEGQIQEEVFAADVTLVAQFVVENWPGFERALEEMSHGSLKAELVEMNQITIMPVGKK